MATEVPNPSEQSVATLVSGIVSDFKDLVKQQTRLIRQEFETVVQKSKESVSFLAAGFITCMIGAFAICLMLAHLFHWLALPHGADPSSLPLWASYAIVAALFFVAGGVMIMVAERKSMPWERLFVRRLRH